MNKRNCTVCLSAVMLGMFLEGCMTADDYRTERAEYTVKHLKKPSSGSWNRERCTT